jgi:anti-anti-sigma regulatory factor
MASNFRIVIHQNSDSLHLKLMGDFDGSSAHELLNTMRSHCVVVNKIFIHTSGLKAIHPFGRAVFQRNLSSLGKQAASLIFTGENWEKITR